MTDNVEYAKLLSSVTIANTSLRRVLSPIQTAYHIKKLVDEEGLDAAEMLLPLNKNNIKSFISLLNLPEECHDGIVWGASNNRGVGFSAASRISILDKKDDQLLLFNETSKMSISKKDVYEIISFYKKQDLPLDKVIHRTTNARPQISNLYLIVISISDTVKEMLQNNALIANKEPSELLCEYFQKKFQITHIDSVQIKGNNVAIGLHETEYRQYKNQISSLGLEYDEITQYLVE